MVAVRSLFLLWLVLQLVLLPVLVLFMLRDCTRVFLIVFEHVGPLLSSTHYVIATLLAHQGPLRVHRQPVPISHGRGDPPVAAG